MKLGPHPFTLHTVDERALLQLTAQHFGTNELVANLLLHTTGGQLEALIFMVGVDQLEDLGDTRLAIGIGSR